MSLQTFHSTNYFLVIDINLSGERKCIDFADFVYFSKNELAIVSHDASVHLIASVWDWQYLVITLNK